MINSKLVIPYSSPKREYFGNLDLAGKFKMIRFLKFEILLRLARIKLKKLYSHIGGRFFTS